MCVMRSFSTSHGFTLVELSIVLVIIGLLIGGILGGQELIRASELNSISTDANKYRTAVHAFKLKYNALPGDMTNATAYWGTNAGCAAATAGTGTQTCNGNGNGRIDSGSPGGAQEFVYIWQHLANSGIIPGNFSGVSPTYYSCTTTNCPAGKISGTVWGAFNWTITDAEAATTYAGWWTDDAKNFFTFGDSGNGAGYPTYNTLTPTDAASVDKKVDDGVPGTGVWRTAFGPQAYSAGCAVVASTGVVMTIGTKANAALSGYAVANSNRLCAFQIYW